jgi:hypothetical protein
MVFFICSLSWACISKFSTLKQNFPYNVAYAQSATTNKYVQYGLNSCVFLVVMHTTTNLTYGVSQTWARILLWGLSYLQHGDFILGF